MPITPLHLGPGAIFKAAGGRRFSFVVFGLAQVAMDLDAVVRFIAGSNLLHGPVHSLLGATVVGMVFAVIGKPLGESLIRFWNWRLSPGQRDWFYVEPRLTWTSAAVAAFLGTYSHVLLDSIMHTDVQPMYPFSADNDLLDFISIDALNGLCLALGIIGTLILFVVLLWRRRLPRT